MATSQLPAIFQNNANLPAHMQSDDDKNIVPRASTNALTFEGKVWSISIDGKKTKLMKTDADGEEQPVQIFTGIVLDYNKQRGRMFYTGQYDAKNPRIPDCWSEDSVKPHANVPAATRQCNTCAACPNAKKGSGTTDDGRSVTACGQFKKLAIIPTAKLGQFPPLRLTLKITSVYDKSGADSHPGWYAWDQYIDLLVSNNVHHTAKLPTKIKFDPTVAYPKLLFAPGKEWLTDEQWEIVKPIAGSDAVRELLADSFKPSDTTGTKPLPDDEEEETEVEAAPVPAQAKTGKATPAKAAPPPADEDEEEGEVSQAAGDEDEEEDAEAQAEAKRQARAAAQQQTANKNVAKAAKAAKAPVQTTEDEEEEGEPAPAPAPAPAKPKAQSAKTGGAKGTPAKAPATAPAAVAGLLDDWDA